MIISQHSILRLRPPVVRLRYSACSLSGQADTGVSLLSKIFLQTWKKNCAITCLHIIFASKYLHIVETRRDVFQAIADPTRREIINLLADKPLHLNAIAENFAVSRQAVSLHIKILEECGLIAIRSQGRERFCEVQLDKLGEVSIWVEQYRRHWESKLDSLEKYLDKLQKQRKHAKRKK
jgi:DNA-binding transcriptional ArsR family regulator